MPQQDDPLVSILDPRAVMDSLSNIRSVVRQCAAAMPKHEDFISQNCAASVAAVG
jgi:hypothetical protein